MKKLLYLFILFISCNTTSQTVVKVHDGDTFYTNDGQSVRLAEIDCPELDQAYGETAHHFVDSIILHKTVKLRKVNTDKYGRIVCEVYIGDKWLNKLIVEAGYAWAYKGLSTLHSAEIRARNAKKGMWVYEYNEPPFKHRKEHNDTNN